MHLTIKKRVELVLMSGADGATNRSVAKKFNRIYPDREPISHTTVGRLILKFRETGSVLDKPKSAYSRVSDETRRRVIEKVESSPMKSIRRSSSELGVPRTTMRRIIKAESFHPYKLQQLNKLYEDDPDRRLQMVTWFKDQLVQNPSFVKHDVLFSDEANFFVNGEVNKQNCRYYSRENPHWMDPTKQHSCPKVVVWCGLWKSHVLGPFFFHETVTGKLYLDMLQNDLMPHLARINEGKPLWFMQDGAPPHYATIVRNWLNGNFENWIGRRGTVEWAPRSPDLTPMDFYFWGHLKQIVYSTRIADVDQLRQQIIRGCNLINGNSDLLDKVYGNFEHRLELCINANGEHFEHL